MISGVSSNSMSMSMMSMRAAPPPPPDPEEKFAELDSDGNGSLEVGEMQPPEGAPMGPPPMDGAGPRSFTDTENALSQYAAYGEEDEESSILSLDLSA